MKRFPERTVLIASVLSLAAALAAGAAAWRSSAARAEERKAAEAAGGGVVLLDAEKVAAAFQKGQMLLTTGEYKVMAGHRVGPGIPEVHAGDTDVFYILDGEATFVTGGTVIEARVETPGETRGARIEGGEARPLKKGDVIVIPRGVPHWFKEVPKLVNYFVVKVTGPAAAAGAGK
jgi:mannose-6-phosphate isomerase-like protein (cupin superfamily)